MTNGVYEIMLFIDKNNTMEHTYVRSVHYLEMIKLSYTYIIKGNS